MKINHNIFTFLLRNQTGQIIFLFRSNHIYIGASIPCCQGTAPTPQADAICGWWFQIDPKDERGNNAAICGKYTYWDEAKLPSDREI